MMITSEVVVIRQDRKEPAFRCGFLISPTEDFGQRFKALLLPRECYAKTLPLYVVASVFCEATRAFSCTCPCVPAQGRS